MRWRAPWRALRVAVCLAVAAAQGGERPAAAATAAPSSARAAASQEPLGAGERRFDDGAPFGTVTLYTPPGTPRSVVIFLSGDAGWRLGVIDMARHLRDAGAAVAGVDVRRYLADVAAHKGGGCRYLAADFETLAHRVERELGLTEYRQPLLYGYSSGASVVYAVLVESPPGTFGAAVSLGFCRQQKFGGVALCPGTGATLTYHAGPKGQWILDPAPSLTERWVAFQGETDAVCPAATVDAFAARVGNAQVIRLASVGHGFSAENAWLPQFMQLFERLAAQSVPAPIDAAEMADLPLIERPVSGDADPDAPLALLLTGDGGWAGLDRGVARALNERGVPLVAISTLRYYWRPRTPEQSAADVARVLRHYLAAWHRSRIMLVGYSFGADVLPFIVNRLPHDLRARILSVNLLGLSGRASFQIRVGGWLPGSVMGTAPVEPELERMQGVKALCLYGSGERHDPCARLARGTLTAQPLGAGHHFGGEYAELAAAMLRHAGLQSLRARAPSPAESSATGRLAPQ